MHEKAKQGRTRALCEKELFGCVAALFVIVSADLSHFPGCFLKAGS